MASVSIPIGEMAKAKLADIFPQLTPDQVKALQEGRPLPAISPPAAEPGSTTALLNYLLTSDVRIDCVMPFADPRRMRRARKAVNQFVAQTHPKKRLVIVNASGTPVTNVPHEAIREVQAPEEAASWSVAALRNYAIPLLDGDAVFPFWDDDDVYDPHLLAYLASQYKYAPLAMTDQVRVDIANATLYRHREPGGIPNTMLVPLPVTFADARDGEDADLWHRVSSRRIIDTSVWPLSTLVTRVFDGHNVLPAERFMVGHVGDAWRGRAELAAEEFEHLRRVFAGFNLSLTVGSPQEAAPQGAPS